MKIQSTITLAALAALTLTCSCSAGGFAIDDESAPIQSVEDGNTVILEDGLTVHLLGLNPNYEFNKQELERLVGTSITLTHDSSGEERFDSYDDEVWAYATNDFTGEPINRKILALGGKKAFDTMNLNDSLASYQKLLEDKRRTLTDTELAAKLKASSMLIVGTDGFNTWIGTGFFINENGLAVTNNHVMMPGASYTLYLSDANGNIDNEHNYGITRIVSTSDHKTGPDYTIFYANLDEDTRRGISYLNVASKPISAGDKVATVGNPAPGCEILNMRYSPGVVSAVEAEKGRIGINVPITHGFSGGPLVNEYGEVIGISSSGYGEANLNFAVDFNIVKDKLEELKLPYGGK